MKSHQYSFELKNDLSELETLCQHLNKFGQDTGLSEACLTDINICLDELFTNIVCYGFKDKLEHLTLFLLQLSKDVLTVVIEDEGVAFNPLEKKDPEIPDDLKDVRIGGLGIHIVRKLMDELHYERKDSRNKLTLKKRV
ncbi:MAG: ATP-binding protein [Desulfobacterales bacterium]|nr:ATP-binding protein [Desulfobacterales bacterium]